MNDGGDATKVPAAWAVLKPDWFSANPPLIVLPLEDLPIPARAGLQLGSTLLSSPETAEVTRLDPYVVFFESREHIWLCETDLPGPPETDARSFNPISEILFAIAPTPTWHDIVMAQEQILIFAFTDIFLASHVCESPKVGPAQARRFVEECRVGASAVGFGYYAGRPT